MSLSFKEILETPYPLFYDYLELLYTEKKKEAEKQKKQMRETTKVTR